MELKKLETNGTCFKVKFYSSNHFNVNSELNESTCTESSTCESNVSKRQNIIHRMTHTNPLQLLQKNACEKIHDN